jgi:Zn-dependent protease
MHWSFLILLAIVVVAEWPGGLGAVAAGLIWIAALFASVVVHELAHCFVARRRGGSVLGILLLPIGGMSRMDRIPSNPSDERAIAAAGPATSFGLGAAFLVLGLIAGGAVWPPTLVAGSWLARLGWLNLLLGAFNLLPALPMDGGRVLRATLARHLSHLSATRIAAAVARVFAVGLVVAGVLWDIWLLPIGFFVFLGASGEEASARLEDRRQHPGPSGWPPPAWGWGPNGPGTGPQPQQQGTWPPPQQQGTWPPPQQQGTWPPPQQQHGWSPPYGWPPRAWPTQRPGQRSAIDVPMEGDGGDVDGGQPLGERVR